MSDVLRIGVILSTTRQGRFADKPAAWLMGLASKQEGAVFELVDLRDYPMPFFDEPRSPMHVLPRDEAAQRWALKIGSLDGFVFVTAEYNKGVPAVLKNALDYVYAEFVRKPAAFVAYGNAGGARSVEQLRLNLAELQVAPVRAAVHIGWVEFAGMIFDGKTFADFPHLERAAEKMFDDLLWWTRTLRAGRQAA